MKTTNVSDDSSENCSIDEVIVTLRLFKMVVISGQMRVYKGLKLTYKYLRSYLDSVMISYLDSVITSYLDSVITSCPF